MAIVDGPTTTELALLSQPIVYRIDADDDIVAVNEAWRAFARDNGAPGLADDVVGTSLWSALDGAEIAMLWRDLLARVRQGVVVAVPYRCDAPGLRRSLRMALQAIPEGHIEFTSTVEHLHERDPIALLSSRYASGEPVRSCSWCRRFDVGGFVEVEEAIGRLGLLEQDSRPVTHGLCPDCAVTVRRQAGLLDHV